MFTKVYSEAIVKVNGEIGTRNYRRGKLLGKGSFGKVYEFTCIENSQVYAAKLICKELLKNSKHYQRLLNEIKLHRSLRHDCIVRFERFFEDKDRIYLLLELCQGGSVLDMLAKRNKITETETQSILYQLLLGLQYLHGKKIIHRDIKIDNLLFTKDMQLKIGDFGLSCRIGFDGDKRRSVCGTSIYIAPEIVDKYSGYSFEVDVWSVGIIAYCLVLGKTPYVEENKEELYNEILYKEIELDEEVSETFKDFLAKTLTKEPRKRASVDELLSHPFFISSPFPRFLPSSSFFRPYSATFQKVPQQVVNSDKRREENTNNKEKPTIQTFYSAFVSGTFVKKWVDCSSNFGIAYLMSTNNIGICFNDSTKLFKNTQGLTRVLNQGCQILDQIPQELHEKAQLFQKIQHNFRKEFTDDPIYVQKLYRDRKSAIFGFSDKSIHAFFEDKSEVLIERCSKRIFYADKRKEISESTISDASKFNHPISKRIQYIKTAITSAASKKV